MIHWKVSALSVALGAAATVGFVWLARTKAKRTLLRLDVAPEDAARADALRDGAFDVATLGPDEIELEVMPLDEERVFLDEPYDAVDPEGIGTEFLRRATEAPSIHPEEHAFSNEPESDASEELPVGSVDAQGNTELHPPDRPSNVPPDLAPNDEELAQRAATERSDELGKSHG